MNQSQMFGNAKWIDCPDGDLAPMFIKKFNAVKGETAEIVICGLGYFELKINGKRVSDDLLVPAASTYNYRDMSGWAYPLFDKMSFRTYVMKYDISAYLIDGENTLEVMLGTGYYHQTERDCEGNVDFGTPKLCYIICKASGEVISDKSTLTHKGYFHKNNLYRGEYQDYTAVPDYSLFNVSREIETPETDFQFNIAPADKVISAISDIKFMGTYEGSDYYDIGINTVGRAVMECNTKGEHFTVAYAEEIGGDYWYGIHFNRDNNYVDEFVADGEKKEYNSLFSWQAFRYLKVTGNAKPIRIEVIHSDCDITSDFECDNDILNWLYKSYVHTQLCNMHSGVPSDCPHRERLGYTGDGQLCAEAAMLMLDSKDFYRKWLNDIANCQCKESGHVQHTAPAMGGGGGPCGWGGAIVEVPYQYYKAYGDKGLLDEFFPKMLHFFDYLESRSDFGLVAREEPDGWCLGDWLPPTPIQVPEALVNSCLYIGFMRKVIEIAEILGRENEVSFLPQRIEKVSAAVNAAYYSHQQRSYCGDINGASSLALSAGLGNDNVKNKLIEKYKKLGQFDTGIIATDKLIGYLFSIGESKLAFDLLTNDKDVSFAHMMKSGATTIWENWDGKSSRNHPMFGAVTKYLFTEILGIKQPQNSSGYKSVVISPCFIEGLNNCKGHITTVNGKISVEYIVKNNKASVKVFSDESIKSCFVYKDISEGFCGYKEFTVEV